MLLGQLHLDRLGCLDGLERAGQVLHSHFQADLIVLSVHALHLVLVKEVGLQGRGGGLVRSSCGFRWTPPRPLSRSIRTLTCDNSHHILTPPLATLLHMTKNRLSGVNLRTHCLVSLEIVVMTPGGQDEQQQQQQFKTCFHSQLFTEK